MEPPPPTTPHRPRLFLVAAALLVLVSVIAFASRTGFGDSSRTAPSSNFANWAFSAFLVCFFLAVPLAIYGAVFLRGRELPLRKQRSFVARVLRGLAILALLFVVVAGYSYLHRHYHLKSVFQNFHPFGTAPAKGGRHGTLTAHRFAFQWPVLVIAGVLVAGFLLQTRTRRAPNLHMLHEDEQDGLADDVMASIGDALDDLEAEPDARRAVVAAYARMEAVFARHGLRRAPSETPIEYLRRVLLGVTARGDAVQALTGLFEEARFSVHEIDAAMKQAAIGALSAIRDDLQGARA